MINEFLDGRTIYQANNIEISQIEAISQSSSGLSSFLSKNILQNLNGTIHPFVPCALPSTLAQLRSSSIDRSEVAPQIRVYDKSRQVLCYPNPAGDFVQFDMSQIPEYFRYGSIEIYNSMGKIVSQKKLEGQLENVIFDTRNMTDGIYFYRSFCAGNQYFSGKFIIQKP